MESFLFLNLFFLKKSVCMALIDCETDTRGLCGSLRIMANLGKVPVRVDVQYPGNENVWYAVGALEPGTRFLPGAGSIRFPGGTLVRATNEASKQHFLMGRVLENTGNTFLVPDNAFRADT